MSVSRLGGSGDSPAQRSGKGKSDQRATERFSRPTFLVSDKQGESFKPATARLDRNVKPRPHLLPYLAPGLRLEA